MNQDPRLVLLQFVGLVAPAAAIYLDFVYGHIDLKRVRKWHYDPEVVEGEIHRGRLSIIILAMAGILLILQLTFKIPYNMSSYTPCLAGSTECISILYTLVVNFVIVSGLVMFALTAGLNKQARNSETGILWGAVDSVNQLLPGEDGPENRTFEPGISRGFLFGLLIVIGSIPIVIACIIAVIQPADRTASGFLLIGVIAGMAVTVGGRNLLNSK